MRPTISQYQIPIFSVLHTLLLCAALNTVFAAESSPAPAIETPLQTAHRLLQQGALQQAGQAYRELIQAQPRLLPAYNNLAVVYARQGKLEAARQTLTRGLRVQADVAALYDNLDAIYVELSRREYGKALRLELGQHKLALKTLPVAKAPAIAVQVPARKAPAVQQVSSPKPVTPSVSASSKLLITDTVHGWASAWSAQQAERYLSFYAQDFKPPNGLARAQWERQRKQRLQRPRWVKVSVSKLRIETLKDGRARVRFVQHYQSDSFSDVTHKELQLHKLAAGWRIEAERSL